MKIKNFIILILLIFTAQPLWSQTESVRQTELAERLHSLAKNAPPEMLYIQTSKDIYETGEDLWFKVYILNSQTLIPSDLSKTLYLQLLNETSKKAVWQEKYEIKNGFADGRVYIEQSLPDGNYLLAAYTANSFINDSSEIKAIRRVKIKTDINSLEPFTAKFDRLFYNDNDSIKVNVSANTNQDDTSGINVTATLNNGNKKIQKVQSVTDNHGKVVISFRPEKTKTGFQVTLKVKNKEMSEPLVLDVPGKSNSIQLTTFPEGGNLVSGIRSRLAFKAVNRNGEPVNISGTLFADNVPLIGFKSTHAGMGSLSFIPAKGKSYSIRLTEPAVDSTYLLPEIYTEGLSLHLIGQDKEFLSFLVSQSDRAEPEEIYLRVQCRGEVYGITSAKLARELIMKVPLSELPQGISEITLFNRQLGPAAERLVYINRDHKLNITAELSRDIIPTRGKTTLKISVKDENGNPVVANLGISVFDKLFQNRLDSNNILAHVFLSTQLRGRIYNPSFYFNGQGKGREEALDLLMQTQGWRKYVWNETTLAKTKDSKPAVTDETNGSVLYPHKHNKVPKKPVFIIAFSPNRDTLNVLIPGGSEGQFMVSTELLKRWETDYVYLKPYGPPGSEFTMHAYDPMAIPEHILGIKLSDPFDIINTTIKKHEFCYPSDIKEVELLTEEDSSLSEAGVIRIKPVEIKGNGRHIIRGKYMGLLDSIATKGEYVCPFGVLNCPRHPPDEPAPIVIGLNKYGEKIPIPGKDYFVIYDYNTPAERVRTIIYRKNRYSEEDLLKINNFSRVKAYYGAREFYRPDYDQVTDEVVPDFRNTLLWEPDVITDENGKATLTFFCSDLNTDFVGRIEGVSGTGLLGTGSFKFTVRKLK